VIEALMSKACVILPGAGDPASLGYIPVYDLLTKEAKKRGFEEVIVIKYPGQMSSRTPGELSLAAAVSVVRETCFRIQGQMTLLGRSFGCFVALETARAIKERVEKVILWGPPPFWHVWEMLARNLDATNTTGLKKGVRFSGDVFAAMKPIESLLKDTRVATQVVAGTRDKAATPDFVAYLQAIVQANAFVKFAPLVEGAEHEVETWDDPRIVAAYANAIFNS
jgi:pimeloyl-ACP methyl ester carboxylesterase